MLSRHLPNLVSVVSRPVVCNRFYAAAPDQLYVNHSSISGIALKPADSPVSTSSRLRVKPFHSMARTAEP